MSRIMTNANAESILPKSVTRFIKRRFSEITGISLILSGFLLLIALLTYTPSDPSLNSAGITEPKNLLGSSGALLADLLLQSIGLVSLLPSLVLFIWGAQTMRKRPPTFLIGRLGLLFLTLLLTSLSLSVLPIPSDWPLATRLGGVIGVVFLEYTMTVLLQGITSLGVSFIVESWMLALISALFAVITTITVLGLSAREWQHIGYCIFYFGNLFLKSLNKLNRVFVVNFFINPMAKKVPFLSTLIVSRSRNSQLKQSDTKKTSTATISPKAAKPKTGKKAAAKLQRAFDLIPNEDFELPPHDLLEAPPVGTETNKINKDSLEQNARFLESVLDDFGVHGEITKVRPGPVVTLYELEPAPGTKTSRVIGLSDDIARSMSAISVRVAVVPGRNVIGIELPNIDKEMVFLRELLTSDPFERASGKLNVALGKDIGGFPFNVDLSKMPHLLIAGTTGSGKSVGINTMILSLLYQLSPTDCKMIMIDPKMLELSVYEGIPHLLTPVVTEPSKAVMALKWAVREMEERYRAMSHLGVRNIAGYNNRLMNAIKDGETLTRRVQTGFDTEGKPVNEDQPLPMDPLPFIVIVIDEMADLMLVAGKDVEAAVQRLAQMARAAGIHMIMATQRPSVDVITGTIKANFPTRISFQVTSKIDSRTILGEQGGEQLLGQGDMLYMAGGGRISRIHGPFVSDEEVENVVNFLKTQGKPEYLDEVTNDNAENNIGPHGYGQTSSDELYDEAVALIAREGKASTSFIQRHLQIGYNRAARIIERMESEGVVSKANRVGRREILIGEVN